MKRGYALILGGCILVLGIAIGGIAIKAYRIPQDNKNVNTVDTVSSAIKEEYGMINCKIEVDYSDDELVSADVIITTNDAEKIALESDILEYISQSLGISAENIKIAFKLIQY